MSIAAATNVRKLMMVNWIARTLLLLAGFVTSWFVAKDAPNFGVVQTMVATLMLALVVFIFAFWPSRWSHLLDRLFHKPK